MKRGVFAAALAVRTVRAVHHGFSRDLSPVMKILRANTPYLPCQLTVGEYHEQGFVGTSILRFGQGCNTQQDSFNGSDERAQQFRQIWPTRGRNTLCSVWFLVDAG